MLIREKPEDQDKSLDPLPPYVWLNIMPEEWKDGRSLIMYSVASCFSSHAEGYFNEDGTFSLSCDGRVWSLSENFVRFVCEVPNPFDKRTLPSNWYCQAESKGIVN